MTIFTFELEQEVDGRWIAEVVEVAGAMAYGSCPNEAVNKANKIALEVWRANTDV